MSRLAADFRSRDGAAGLKLRAARYSPLVSPDPVAGAHMNHRAAIDQPRVPLCAPSDMRPLITRSLVFGRKLRKNVRVAQCCCCGRR